MDLPSIVVGAGLAAAGGFCVRLLSYAIDRKAARTAIRAEIEAILNLFEEERIIDNLQGEVDWLEHSREPREFPVSFRTPYNIIFSGNVSNLGLLVGWGFHDYWRIDTDILRDVTRFYYSVQTIIELAEMIRDAELPAEPRRGILGLARPGVYSLSDPDHRLTAFKRLLGLTMELRNGARSLLDRLC